MTSSVSDFRYTLKIFSGSSLSLALILEISLHQRLRSAWLKDAISVRGQCV